MHESITEISLKTGETVAASRIEGPDAEWAERIEALLGHKGEEWRWQNSRCARDDLGIDVYYYVLHRDGVPFANMMTAEYAGVGHFGHVWTLPEDRRKGAADQLMGLQMEDFRARGGRALYLGTGFDSAPYHIYAAHGFEGIEDQSGNMEYYATSRRDFEDHYFAAGATDIEEVAWRHWPATGALFLGDFPGTVRCAPLGLLGRASTEHPLLGAIREAEQRRDREEPTRVRVLMQRDSAAAVGMAVWDWHSLWPHTALLDVFCHPNHWDRAAELLDSLPLPVAERYVAYSDSGNAGKDAALASSGFAQTGVHENRVAIDSARTRFADVSVWERQ